MIVLPTSSQYCLLLFRIVVRYQHKIPVSCCGYFLWQIVKSGINTFEQSQQLKGNWFGNDS